MRADRDPPLCEVEIVSVARFIRPVDDTLFVEAVKKEVTLIPGFVGVEHRGEL